MPRLLGTGVKLLLLLHLISGFHALLRVFGLVGSGISIHDTHVVNTVCDLHPEVSDEDTPSIFLSSFKGYPLSFSLPPCTERPVYIFWVVTHMRGGEGLA